MVTCACDQASMSVCVVKVVYLCVCQIERDSVYVCDVSVVCEVCET